MPFGFLTFVLVALNSISTQTVLGDATHWSAGEQEVKISCSSTCKFTEGLPYELNCEVLSPSNLTSIEWYHNGEMFNRTSVTSSSTSNYRVVLYLKNISAAEGGIYSCQALYVNESKMSNDISVTVQYSPVCVDDERNEYFHNEKELQIFCNVKSNPPPIANEYRWEINTTTGIQRLPDEVASITYSIPNTPPFGTLFCGAFNGIGDQEKKCVIRVLKATLPDPVHDCQKNKSYADGAIRITCQTGSDGGLTANFSLVVQSLDTGDIVYQNTSTSPHFIVTGLVTGQYSITLKAINSVGAQSFSEVYNHTTSDNGISSEIISPYDLVFIVAVIVAVFILIIAVLAVFIYKRRRAAGADETRIPMNRNPTDTLESHPNSQPEHQPLNPQD